MIDDKKLTSEEAAAARNQAADEAANIRYLAPGDFEVFEQSGEYRLTFPDDRSYVKFNAYKTFPLTLPEQYISLRAGNDEIGIIRDLKEFDKGTQQVVRELLTRRYFVPKLQRIVDVKERYGGMIWVIDTDRGQKTIITKSLQESIFESSAKRYFLTDVEGNRYEIRLDEVQIDTATWIESRI